MFARSQHRQSEIWSCPGMRSWKSPAQDCNYCTFSRQRSTKPSSGLKPSFSGSEAHPKFETASKKIIFPEIAKDVRKRVSVIPWTKFAPNLGFFCFFWSLRRRSGKQLFYWTGSLTNSIKSPGWQSSREQSISRFSHETPCLFLNFWRVDWLNSPSVRILFVL